MSVTKLYHRMYPQTKGPNGSQLTLRTFCVNKIENYSSKSKDDYHWAYIIEQFFLTKTDWGYSKDDFEEYHWAWLTIVWSTWSCLMFNWDIVWQMDYLMTRHRSDVTFFEIILSTEKNLRVGRRHLDNQYMTNSAFVFLFKEEN